MPLLSESIQDDLSWADNRGKRIGVLLVDPTPDARRAATLNRIPSAVWTNVEEVAVFGTSDGRSKLAALPVPSYEAAHAQGLDDPNASTLYAAGALRKAGFRYFIDRGFDVLAVLRADGRHPPELLANMYRPIVADQADAVFGSPNANHGGPLNEMEKVMFGLHLSNFHCGYRAYNLAALRAIHWERLSDGETFDLELVLKLRHQNFRIREMAIPGDCGSRTPFLRTLRQSVATVYRYRQTRSSLKRYPEFEEYFTHYPVKESKRSSHAYAEDLVGTGHEVLDIGCGEGILAAKLTKNGNRVTGADILPRPANESALEQYFSVDLNRGDRTHDRGFAWQGLRSRSAVGCFGTPGATRAAAAASPASAEAGRATDSLGAEHCELHYSDRAAFGRFGYTERGILDKTHVRFFTRKTIRRMLLENDYDVVEERETVMPVELFFGLPATNPLMRFANEVLGGLTRLLPGLLGYQIMLVLKNGRRETEVRS